MPPTSDRRILVVDDPAVRLRLAGFLGAWDYSVQGVADAEQALARIRETAFTVAIRLPGVSGKDLFQKPLPDPTVIVDRFERLVGHHVEKGQSL
jgi:CheY-like chemotaxis protein